MGEAQLSLLDISSSKMQFWHVLSMLDTKTSAQATHFINRVETIRKYQSLISFVMKTYLLACWEQIMMV